MYMHASKSKVDEKVWRYMMQHVRDNKLKLRQGRFILIALVRHKA